MINLNILENNLSNALFSLSKKKHLNILIVLSMFLGLLFPIIVLCFGMAGLNFIDSGLINDYERVATLKIEDNSLFENNISDIINANEDIESICRYLVTRKTALIGTRFSSANVKGVDLNCIEFNNLHIREGKWFDSDSINNACVIGEKYSVDNFNGKAIGEKINLAGQDLYVIAITDEVRFSENIIITISCAERLNLINSNQLKYYVKFKSANSIPLKTNMLKDYITSRFGFSSNITVFKNEYKNQINNAIEYIFILLAIVIIVLVYSLSNTANIVRNRVHDTKKGYGIRMALGATDKDIYLQNFFEFLVLNTISMTMVFSSIYFIALFANNLIGYTIIKLDYIVIFISGIVCVFISFIMSYFTLRKELKLNVIEVLRG